MKTVEKISSGQFFSLMLLSRLLVTITFMPIYDDTIRTTDYLISEAIGFALIPVFFIPVFLLYRKNRDKNIVDLAYDVSPVFSKIISVLCVLLFVYYAFVGLSMVNLFVASVIFPDIDTKYFIILLIITVCFAASLGIEALGRASTISLSIFLVTFLIILLTLINKIDISNLTPAFYDGAKPIVKSSWSIVARTVEIAVAAILVPKVKGNLKKGSIISFVVYFLFGVTLFFFLMTTVGEFAFLQLFPIQTMVVLSEFSIFERLDVLLTSVWVITAFIKISLMVYLSTDLLQKSFKSEHKKIYIIAIGLFLTIAVILQSSSITLFKYSTDILWRTITFLVLIVGLPLSVLIINKISARKLK